MMAAVTPLRELGRALRTTYGNSATLGNSTAASHAPREAGARGDAVTNSEAFVPRKARAAVDTSRVLDQEAAAPVSGRDARLGLDATVKVGREEADGDRGVGRIELIRMLAGQSLRKISSGPPHEIVASRPSG
jgi:hypothetical protein